MSTRLSLAVIVMATAAFAQGRGGGGGGRNSGDMGAILMPSPMTRFERISEILRLSKDEKKQVKSILDDAQAEAAPLRDELVKSHEQIAKAVEAGKSQDDINPLVNSHAALEARMAVIEMKAFTRIYQALNEEQKAEQKSMSQLFMMMPHLFQRKNWNAAD